MKKLLLQFLICIIASSSLSNASTITVGENGCDFYRIEPALDSAIPGDIIEVHSGEYWVNLNITTPSVVLRGNDTGGGMPILRAGSSTADIEKSSSGSDVLVEKTGGTAIAIRADFVTVEGFVITGVTWPIPYGTLEHNDLIGNAGIRVYSDFNKISNNTFEGNDLTAIGLWNCSSNKINKNTIKDIPFGYGIELYNSHYNTIEGNVLTHNDWAIELQRSDSNIINENEIVDSINDGIKAMNCNYTSISGNLISRNGLESDYEGNGKGIYIVGSMGVIVDNTISFNKDCGIYIESIYWEYCSEPPCGVDESYDNLIIDNRIRGNGNDGIRLEKTWINQIWDNNITSNHGNGIGLALSHNNTLELNNISENDHGVYLDRSNYTKVNNNTINVEKKSGIHIWSCFKSYAYNNTLIDLPIGVALEESSTNNVLTQNVISNSTDGINISGMSSENQVLKNTVSSCDYGIYLKGAIKNEIVGNIITDNLLGLIADSISNGNAIYENDLSYNDKVAFDEGINRWDNGSRGNFYGSEGCEDADSNGICDELRVIPGGDNTDGYPLARALNP